MYNYAFVVKSIFKNKPMKSNLLYKVFLVCLGCFCIIGVSQSQNNLILQFVDKTQVNSAINTISKITFSGDNLEMNYTDGTLNSYAIATVGKISFNIVSDVNELSSPTDQIMLYPNPANDVLYLKNIPDEQQTVAIFKLDGSCIKIASISEISSGLNISDLNPGIYVLKIGVKALKFTKL